jgi:pSer/pThr/pTyr-binding forkhead associated (FHA) protein
VICITCGRDNPDTLIFCQECGQKLGAQGVIGGAPPTPIIGLSGAAGSPTAASARETNSSQPPPRPSLIPQRPPAPEVNFVGGEREGDGGGSAQASADGNVAADAPCPLCGHRNPRSLRFCVTCGHLLPTPSFPPPPPYAGAGSSAPRAGNNSSRPAPPARGAPVGRVAQSGQPDAESTPQTMRPPAFESLSATAQSPIAPARVVDLGAPAGDAMLRLCPRCRGGSDPSSHFCRFCGASLADAPSIALAPRTPPPPPIAEPAAFVAPTPVPPAAAQNSPAPVRSTVAMVSPISGPMPRARLILIARDGGEGPGYPLGEGSDIGRSEGNILLGDDRYVSPRHARIQARGGVYYLRDLGSTNGVYVRIPFAREASTARRSESASPGSTSLEQAIVDQDLFLVGQQVLKFEVVKHAEEGFGVASENGTLVFGTPAAPRYARLTQRTVEGVVRDVYHLQKAETIIGREVGDLVFTEDPFLSRRHAAVVIQGVAQGSKGHLRRYSLMDLGSSNGTFLQLREEIRLKNGDHLRIGQQLFRFDLDRPDA